MIDTILRFTNKKIEVKKQNFSRDRDAKDTDITEIKALLGLLYMAGTLKSSHENLDDLYATDFTGGIFPFNNVIEKDSIFIGQSMVRQR